MPRIFKYGDILNITFTPDKELNILIYRSPSYLILYRSHTLFKNGPVFLAHPVDTVPPTDVVWNYVATDKLTTHDGDEWTGAGVVADVRATPHRLTPVLPRHTT